MLSDVVARAAGVNMVLAVPIWRAGVLSAPLVWAERTGEVSRVFGGNAVRDRIGEVEIRGCEFFGGDILLGSAGTLNTESSRPATTG